MQKLAILLLLGVAVFAAQPTKAGYLRSIFLQQDDSVPPEGDAQKVPGPAPVFNPPFDGVFNPPFDGVFNQQFPFQEDLKAQLDQAAQELVRDVIQVQAEGLPQIGQAPLPIEFGLESLQAQADALKAGIEAQAANLNLPVPDLESLGTQADALKDLVDAQLEGIVSQVGAFAPQFNITVPEAPSDEQVELVLEDLLNEVDEEEAEAEAKLNEAYGKLTALVTELTPKLEAALAELEAAYEQYELVLAEASDSVLADLEADLNELVAKLQEYLAGVELPEEVKLAATQVSGLSERAKAAKGQLDTQLEGVKNSAKAEAKTIGEAVAAEAQTLAGELQTQAGAVATEVDAKKEEAKAAVRQIVENIYVEESA
jgi:hypothetical protein